MGMFPPPSASLCYRSSFEFASVAFVSASEAGQKGVGTHIQPKRTRLIQHSAQRRGRWGGGEGGVGGGEDASHGVADAVDLRRPGEPGEEGGGQARANGRSGSGPGSRRPPLGRLGCCVAESSGFKQRRRLWLAMHRGLVLRFAKGDCLCGPCADLCSDRARGFANGLLFIFVAPYSCPRTPKVIFGEYSGPTFALR